MSRETTFPQFPDGGFSELPEKQALILQAGAPVTAAAALADTVAAGFGDGTVRFFRSDDVPIAVNAHKGAVLCLVANGEHALTGGDDGRFLRISPDGTSEEIANFGTRWVDCVASRPGMIACSSGRVACVWREGETGPKKLQHPSTVGGLEFDDATGRLAVTHHRGATLWDFASGTWHATELEWKGLHTAVSFSPDGRHLVAQIEDRLLNGWRLDDGADFQLYGYVNKPKSFAWIGDVPHLATSGAYDLICWPFDCANGPKDRQALRVPATGQAITVVEAGTGETEIIVGCANGEVALIDLTSANQPKQIQPPTGAEVTALALSKSLPHVFVGRADGSVAWAPFQN